MQRIILVASMIGFAMLGCEEEKKPPHAATATAAPVTAPAPVAAPVVTATPAPSASADPERAKLMTQKNDLKAKVESGKASAADKKELKELCKQLGDISCVR